MPLSFDDLIPAQPGAPAAVPSPGAAAALSFDDLIPPPQPSTLGRVRDVATTVGRAVVQPSTLFEKLTPDDVTGIEDRVVNAGGALAQGVGNVVASIPKSLSITSAQIANERLRGLDTIEPPAPASDDPHEIAAYRVRRAVVNPTPDVLAERRAFLEAEAHQPITQRPLYHAGEQLEQFVKDVAPTDPRFADEWLAQKIPQGLGSVAGFMGLGVLGRAAGFGTSAVATAGAASQGTEQFEDAIKHHASLEDAFKSFNLGALVGTSEAVPIAHLFERLDKGTGGSVRRLLVNAMVQGTEEAAQEAFQNIAGNLIANKIVAYDPNRGTFDGTGEAAGLGFTVGALATTIGHLVMGRRGRHAQQPGSEAAPPGSPPGAQPSFHDLIPPGASPASTLLPTPEYDSATVPNPDAGNGPAAPGGSPPVGVLPAPADGQVPGATQPAPQSLTAPLDTAPVEAPGPAAVAPTPDSPAIPPDGLTAAPPPMSLFPSSNEAEKTDTPPEPAGRHTLKAMLDDPRTADEMRADMAAQQAAAAEARNFQPTAEWQDIPAEFDQTTFDPALSLEGRSENGKSQIRIAPPSGSREAPVDLQNPTDVHAGAERTAQPTPAQAEAGNYQKRHVTWNGLDIAIETEAGQDRTGISRDGKPWSHTLAHPYGYIKRTVGKDGDQVDVYLGPHPQSKRVFVFDQIEPDARRFDEHKLVIGARTIEEATRIYDSGFGDGSAMHRRGAVTEMSPVELKTWLKSGSTKKPLAYKAAQNIKPAGPRNRGPLSLFQFLARNGGVQDHGGELRSMGLHRVYVHGIGRLVRPTGKTLDQAREAAVEASYLSDTPYEGGVTTSTTRDLLDAIDREMRGQKVYSAMDLAEAHERQAKRQAAVDAERVTATEEEVRDYAKQHGVASLTDDEVKRAAELVLTSGMDPIDAVVQVVEQAAYEGHDEVVALEPQERLGEQPPSQDAAAGADQAGAGPAPARDQAVGAQAAPAAEPAAAGEQPGGAEPDRGEPAQQAQADGGGGRDAAGAGQPGPGIADLKRNKPDAQQTKAPETGPSDSRPVPVQAAETVPGVPLQPTPKPISKAAQRRAQHQQWLADLKTYFTPGEIVRSYGGFDRVISYQAGTATGPWSITVRSVVQGKDGQWIDDPSDTRTRNHSTLPSRKDVADVLKARSSAAPRAAVADGPAFKSDVSAPGVTFHKPFTDKFLEHARQVYPLLRAELDRIGLKNVGLKLADTIELWAEGKLGNADGTWHRGVITLALDGDAKFRTLHHEALHGLKRLGLFTDGEWSILARKSEQAWRKQFDIDSAYQAWPEHLQVEEGIAHAYAAWADGKATVDGRVARLFKRIQQFLESLGTVLRGQGFKTAESIFEAIDRGEIGGRATNVPNVHQGTLAYAVRSNDGDLFKTEIVQTPDGPREQAVIPGAEKISPKEQAERKGKEPKRSNRPQKTVDGLPLFEGEPDPELPLFALRQAPVTAAQHATVMQGFLARGQYLDRALRVPFSIFGGLTPDGQFKPGIKLFDKAAHIITGAQFSPEGRFAFINPILETARAGLVDRYTLRDFPEYQARDRAKALDERAVMLQGAQILQSLKDHAVGPAEAKVLQAILTGENVSNADMMKLAEPIRAAVDQLGQEAVALGLVSAESFERNRGTYLHRVYQKYESEQNGLARMVNGIMGAKRNKIIGDQLKGRGIFQEVAPASLLRNTDAALTARKRSDEIRALDKRRDALNRRKEVALARAEERTGETAATFERRLDTAEASKALQRPGGATVVRKPSSFQKGQVREQGTALTRLSGKTQRATALLQRIAGQLAQVESKIEIAEVRLATDQPLIKAETESGKKYIRLDEMAGPSPHRAPDSVAEEKVARTVWWPADKAIPEQYASFRNQGTWEVRGSKGGKPVLWRDYTKDERVKMGEILDARYTIGKTFMLMAHDLANGKLYKDISENEDWTWSKTDWPPGGKADAAEWIAQGRRLKGPSKEIEWVKVPGTEIPNSGGKKRWGALADKWVREPIWRDLNETAILSRPNVWRTLLTQWKLNKTARSPVVHMNNVMSNFVLMDLLDVRFQDFAQGIKSYLAKDANYEEAFQHGAFGADAMSQEVRDNVLRPILEELERGNTFQQGGHLGALGQMSKFTELLWSKLKALDQKMIDAYRVEDEVFRMATYIRRRQLGDDARQAADHAREQFIDYDIRAPWVNMARNTVLPFISYTYRAAPLVARAIATRPWKLGKYFLLAYAANAFAYALTGGDEDKERRSLREREQGRAWIGAYNMTRMPFNDRHGNPIFLDIRRWVPAGDVFDMSQGDIPAWLNIGGPLMIGAELFLNRSAFTNQEIVNTKIDDIWGRAGKRADHLYKSFMPSAAWVPGSWYWEKIAQAAKGATDRQGRPYSIGLAAASSVGVKLKPQDIDDAFMAKGYEFARIERELNEEASRLAMRKGRNIISQDEFDKAMASIAKKREAVGKKAAETFK